MTRAKKTGRNDPCPCGSGRKFKVCCGAAGAAKSAPRNVPSDGGGVSLDALVHAAEGHLKARRYEDAITLLLEAVRIAPDQPTVTNNLGGAYLALRRLPEAIRWLRRSIELRPTFARSHYHLGIALQQVSEEGEALVAYARAAELAPGLVEAHSKLGDLLWEKGRLEPAVASYERAFAAAPETPLGRLSRAKARMVEERASEAEAALRDLLRVDASNGDAHLALAHVLNDGGRFEEARTHFERSIAIAPRQVNAYKGLVSSRKITRAERPLLAQILERLEGNDLGERWRMTLHFAAGKAYDDLEEYENAIRHFDEANRLRRKLAPKFDREKYDQRIERLMKRFTPAFFAEHAAAGNFDETPLLVLGMPRSGTTLIERMLSSHPSVAGGGELRFWREKGLAWAEAEAGELDKAVAPVSEEYLRVLRSIGPHALRVTDKQTFNFRWIGLIHFVFPNARIVHSRRNPIDTCLSLYMTQFGQDWGFASDRADLVAYYRGYERLMEHWRRVIPRDRLLEIEYEEATFRPEEIARKLVAFAGLPWDDACLRPDQNPDPIRTSSKWQARQPIYRSSVERWRKYEAWLGELGELRELEPVPSAFVRG